jgi:hypothetical protein
VSGCETQSQIDTQASASGRADPGGAALGPPRSVGRIPELLSEIAERTDEVGVSLVEELLRAVTDCYGVALGRLSASLAALHGGVEQLSQIAADQWCGGLLALHGLHPVDVRTRVETALAELGARAGRADVRLLELDEDVPAARLRVVDAGEHRAEIEAGVRAALERAAPELVIVDIERPLASTPVRLGPSRRGASGLVGSGPVPR